MPIIRRGLLGSDDDELQRQGRPQQQTPGQASMGAPERPSLQRSAGGAAQQPTQRSGSFQGVTHGGMASLADYYRANMGQAQGMADKALGGVQAEGAMLQSAGRRGGQALQGNSHFAGAGANVAGGVDVKSLSEQAGDVQRKADLLSTQGGRQEALRQQYGTSSAGESALDAALLGGAAGGRIDKARTGMAALGDYFRQDEASRRAAGEALQAGRTANPSRATADHAYGPNGEATNEAPRNVGVGKDANAPMQDISSGLNASKDPNTLSDNELNAMGYMHQPAPGESYEHYSNRIAARKGVGD